MVAILVAMCVCAFGAAVRAQECESATLQTPPTSGGTAPGQQVPSPPTPGDRPSFAPAVKRWIEVQNVTVNLRYRYVETGAGVVTTNQLQHRETFRGRVKFDARARYALNVGLFTGVRFTSGWDNTGWGINPAQKNLAFKALYFAAQPVGGIEAQLGGLYIVKGESTELTTYDEDGYVTGARVTVRRPKALFFDEISVTNAYFVGGTGPTNVPISKRLPHIDEPNYQHYLIDKKLGTRAAVSADYTVEIDRKTWRQAINIKTKELRVVDSIVFEHYQRTNSTPANGFAITFEKALSKKVSLNQFGYARIDPGYGPLNADRFNVGNRAFAMITYAISPQFTASFFITTAVGANAALPQRTLSNTVITYNALPALRRTGLF
jgi:hypothetical protein